LTNRAATTGSGSDGLQTAHTDITVLRLSLILSGTNPGEPAPER